MGADKKRAIRREWRISEKTLFAVAILGGSLGAVCGMWVFHHKTKHWHFVWGMPVILLIHFLLVGLYFYLIGNCGHVARH